MIKLAFYKGPAPTVPRRIAHTLICWRTGGPFSHVELVDADGYCWGSTFLDGGVRRKYIELDSGHWDIVTVRGDLASAVQWFKGHDGAPYDWLGLLSWILPWRVSVGKWSFCSKAIATAMDLPNAWHLSPNDLYTNLPRS